MTTVTITFSANVSAEFCNASVRGKSWEKTGNRTGKVEDLDSGFATLAWTCLPEDGGDGKPYTITLGDAVFAYPPTGPNSKECKWLQNGEGYGSNLIKVS